MTRQDFDAGDKVIIETIPEGPGKKDRKISFQHGNIVQLCDRYAAVSLGKYVECFDYNRIQKAV